MENTHIYEVEYDEEKRRMTVEVSQEFYDDLVKWQKKKTQPQIYFFKNFFYWDFVNTWKNLLTLKNSLF